MKKLYIIAKGIVTAILISLGATHAAYAKPIQIPLAISYGVEPNAMILLDNSGSMSTNTLDDGNGNIVTRLQVAKNAITDVLEKTENVRFCMSIFEHAFQSNGFYTAPGALIDSTMECSSDPNKISTMVNTVNALPDPPPPTSTQLAETYYDITRYFRGQDAYFGSFSGFDSPINYRCQANNVIVVTDGESQLDWDNRGLPGQTINLGFESVGGKSLPNWDNNPADGTYHVKDGNGQFPQYSDGLCGTDTPADNSNCGNSTNYLNNSRTIFLDDLALFGSEKDMRTPGDGQGAELSGGSWNDPDFPDQTLDTFVIGFGFQPGNAPQVLDDAAEYGNSGEAYNANSAGALQTAIENSVAQTTSGNGSGAGATQSSLRLDQDGSVGIYLTEYDSVNWAGDLSRVDFTENVGTGGSISFDVDIAWSAAEGLKNTASSRNIFTYNPITKSTVNFNYDSLSAFPDSSIFGDDTAIVTAGKTQAQLTMEYLRGDQTHEALVDHDNDPLTDPERLFRERDTPLGDMVNSPPRFVRNLNFGFLDEDYGHYLESNKHRAPMIYVGANDGMLHAFQDNDSNVVEKFAFMPSTVLNSVPALANESFNSHHHYYVDGPMTTVDAKLNGNWATVLGSPLGRGFKGAFLLDISNPDANQGSLFKWEINEKTLDSSGNEVYSKMGYMMNPPKIMRFQTAAGGEKWAMVVGNGVHSEDADDNDVIGKASIFIIDLDNGELLKEIVLDNGYLNQNQGGTPAYAKLVDGNGITSVSVIDTNSNSFADRIYAADLKGNIWRIDYNSSSGSSFSDHFQSAYIDNGHAAPIFKAEGPIRANPGDTSPSGPNIGQPITAELTITKAPEEFSGGEATYMIFFGTGQYYMLPHILDTENLKVQSMYGIVDRGGWASGSTIDKNNDLVEQGLNETGDRRSFINYPIDYAKADPDLGWYIDLPTFGERILIKPPALYNFISFSSQIPRNADLCLVGTDGWNMLANRTQATSIGQDSSGNPIAGLKVVDQPILDPIYVESAGGTIYSPEIDMSSVPISAANRLSINKAYSRAAWMKVQ